MITDEMINFVVYMAYNIDIEENGSIPALSIEEAQYTINQWIEEGNSDCIPEGFTAKIFSLLWNKLLI